MMRRLLQQRTKQGLYIYIHIDDRIAVKFFKIKDDLF